MNQPRRSTPTRDGRATSPTMWPTSCGSAALSAKSCQTFWRPIIPAARAASQWPIAITTSSPAGSQGGPCRASFPANSRTQHSPPHVPNWLLFGALVWQSSLSPLPSARFHRVSSRLSQLLPYSFIGPARSPPSFTLVSESGRSLKGIRNSGSGCLSSAHGQVRVLPADARQERASRP